MAVVAKFIYFLANETPFQYSFVIVQWQLLTISFHHQKFDLRYHI